MPDNLFERMGQVKNRVRLAQRVTLFLDYDGTLVRFASRPQDAMPPRQVLDLLRELAANPKVRPVIITGRSLKDITEMIGIENLDYIGFHGFEVQVCGRRESRLSPASAAALRSIREDAEKEFAGIEGIWIENKAGASVNFHYRDYDGEPAAEKERFIEIVRKHARGKLRIIGGSRILEALPGEWDKGKASAAFISEHHEDSLPVYFGDDMTDEDAFETLLDKGITVYVRNGDDRRTSAQFFVENPGEVMRALRELFPKPN